MKKRVLILCTGNCCRSQMAEALWRHHGGGSWEVFSAGSHPAGFVHPRAIEVMEEMQLDLSGQTSKSVEQFADESFDLVVTVCDRAKRACPTFPGAARTEHWPFPDPVDAAGSNEEVLAAFRDVRDAIAKRISEFLSDGS